MNISEFGQTIKQKYPEYQDMSDQELGSKVLFKYPEYKDMVQPTVFESLTQSPIVNTILGPSVKFAQDISSGLGQKGTGAVESAQAATEAASKAYTRALRETDPVKKANLMKVAGQGYDVVQKGTQSLASQYSPDVSQGNIQRGLGVGSNIASVADIVNFLTGSPAIGAFQKPSGGFLKEAITGIGPTSGKNVVQTALDTISSLSPRKIIGKQIGDIAKEGGTITKPELTDILQKGITGPEGKFGSAPQYKRALENILKEKPGSFLEGEAPKVLSSEELFNWEKQLGQRLPKNIFESFARGGTPETQVTKEARNIISKEFQRVTPGVAPWMKAYSIYSKISPWVKGVAAVEALNKLGIPKAIAKLFVQ